MICPMSEILRGLIPHLGKMANRSFYHRPFCVLFLYVNKQKASRFIAIGLKCLISKVLYLLQFYLTTRWCNLSIRKKSVPLQCPFRTSFWGNNQKQTKRASKMLPSVIYRTQALKSESQIGLHLTGNYLLS